MHNLWEYGLWLVLVTINAIVVSQQINHLILVSGEVAGLAVGFFLTIFLASLMFLLIRTMMSWLDRRRYERRFQKTKVVKTVGAV